MPTAVRLMHRQDISQVIKIDKEAFPDEWPPTNFNRELGNKLAHYIVAYDTNEINPRIEPEPGKTEKNQRVSFLQRLRKIFLKGRASGDKEAGEESLIVGYAGMWIMVDEAHITSIASHKDWRHKGIGEIMLIYLIEMAMKQKARVLTLEVRVSNQIAQNLYCKFGFRKVGTRKGYYLNNREDAIIMSTDYIGSTSFAMKLNQIKQAYHDKWGKDNLESSNQ